MKNGILYLLLFTYSISIIKPVLPYSSDFIAHLFWYSEHIATVHCVNGKYHVHYEVMEATKKSSSEKGNLSKNVSADDHLLAKVPGNFSTNPVANNDFITYSAALLSSHHQSVYPPPKQVDLKI
jgi:hypothetical protein